MRAAPLEELSPARFGQVFSVLERVDRATDVQRFAELTLEALGSVLGYRDTTFFLGPTYGGLFADPDPLLNGRQRRLIREYRAHWDRYDVFAGPEESAVLNREHAAALDPADRIPPEHRAYVDWLAGHGIESLSAIRVGPAGQQALFGVFGARGTVDPTDLRVLRLVGRQLDAIARNLPLAQQGPPDLALAPRVVEVGGLLVRGLTNAAIARTMGLSEDTVKKYVGRLFAATGTRSRTELALHLRAQA